MAMIRDRIIRLTGRCNVDVVDVFIGYKVLTEHFVQMATAQSKSASDSALIANATLQSASSMRTLITMFR